MKILLVNDDGIRADGIHALAEKLGESHDVFVAAPEKEMSGASMGVTIRKPVLVRPVELPTAVRAWSVAGTPVDCVKLAVHELLDEPPDVLISGINRGVNVGINLLYSGTVAALLEGTFQGIAGMAVSVPSTGGPGFEYAALVTEKLVEKFFSGRPFGPLTLNVNFPPVEPGDIRGARITTQCAGGIDEHYQKQETAEGAEYTLKGSVFCTGEHDNHDTAAMISGHISITPIHQFLTSHELLEILSRANLDDILTG